MRSNREPGQIWGTLAERVLGHEARTACHRNALGAALFLCAVFAYSCVQTAECDATVPCEAGDFCYDYVCRPVCAFETECGRNGTCAPCQQDDAEGTIDHCFEATARVCIPEVAN